MREFDRQRRAAAFARPEQPAVASVRDDRPQCKAVDDFAGLGKRQDRHVRPRVGELGWVGGRQGDDVADQRARIVAGACRQSRRDDVARALLGLGAHRQLRGKPRIRQGAVDAIGAPQEAIVLAQADRAMIETERRLAQRG